MAVYASCLMNILTVSLAALSVFPGVETACLDVQNVCLGDQLAYVGVIRICQKVSKLFI